MCIYTMDRARYIERCQLILVQNQIIYSSRLGKLAWDRKLTSKWYTYRYIMIVLCSMTSTFIWPLSFKYWEGTGGFSRCNGTTKEEAMKNLSTIALTTWQQTKQCVSPIHMGRTSPGFHPRLFHTLFECMTVLQKVLQPS